MIFKPNNHELIQIQDRERREKYGGGSERRKMDRNKEGKREERKERWARIEREINRIFNSF